MIHVEEHKHETEHEALVEAPVPQKVYISLSQHLGRICEPQVKVGDQVLRGQCIGRAEARIWAPVHASVSGTVSGITDWPHPVVGQCRTVVIDASEDERAAEGVGQERTEGEVAALTREELRAIVFEAGVVGMGGASFPTHIKLNPPTQITSLIINGAECEPYLTCDDRLMRERCREILTGIKVIQRCVDAQRVYIAIEDNKPEAVQAFYHAVQGTGYEVAVLKAQYPQGGEKQLIKKVLSLEVLRGKLPFDVGVVVQNVATVHAVYDAVYHREPLTMRTVTVAGGCVAEPKNFWARIGTPVKELFAHCGGLKEEPAKIISGGPMMGIAQYSDAYPVTKTTSGVLALTKAEARIFEEENCIRCGQCVHTCPMSLMPTLIAHAGRKEAWQQAKYYGALDCIECGVCTYVCPSKIKLVQSIKRAKQELMKR